MPKIFPLSCSGFVISFVVTKNARLDVFLRLPIKTRSPPARLLAIAAAPPITATMAGLAGKSGPPGNQNAFRHGLASISQRRLNGDLQPTEKSIREEILTGLLADRCGSNPIGNSCENLLINVLIRSTRKHLPRCGNGNVQRATEK